MSVNWEDHLKTYFGFSGFKGNQQAIIESIAAGKDTFVIMLLFMPMSLVRLS